MDWPIVDPNSSRARILELEDELARLREALEGRRQQIERDGVEIARLREEWTKLEAAAQETLEQRDSLLAALREIDDRAMMALGGTGWGPLANIHDIALAAISEFGGEKPKNHVHGFSNNPPCCRSEVEGEK